MQAATGSVTLAEVAEKRKTAFIAPMLLFRTEKFPERAERLYEIKLDGFRALAIKTGGKVQLRSRNDNDLTLRYPGLVEALAPMPDETVIDWRNRRVR